MAAEFKEIRQEIADNRGSQVAHMKGLRDVGRTELDQDVLMILKVEFGRGTGCGTGDQFPLNLEGINECQLGILGEFGESLDSLP